MEKRWRTDIPVMEWLDQSCQDQMKTKLHNVDHLTLTETYCTTYELPRFETDSDTVPNLEGATVSDKPSCLDWSNDNTKVQCLEEKAYSETLPHLEKFKIRENVFSLQEDSDNDTLLVLDGDTGDDRTSGPDCNTHNNNASHLEGYATGLDAILTCASYDKSNENSSDSGEFINFNVGGLVSGICSHNNTIFLVKRFDNSLYMYRSTGELENKHIITGMNKSRNVILVRMDEGDKLVITSFDPCSLYYIPVEAAGDKCVLGESSSQTLNYAPRGLCVDYQQNLVVLDDRNKSLHFYNSSEDEVMTMKLPSGVDPVYVCVDQFGGYVVTDKNIIKSPGLMQLEKK